MRQVHNYTGNYVGNYIGNPTGNPTGITNTTSSGRHHSTTSSTVGVGRSLVLYSLFLDW